MKNLSSISIILTVTVVLFLIVGVYLLKQNISDNQIMPSKNTGDTQLIYGWMKESSQEISDNTIFSREVELSGGGFENQQIVISSYTTELSPEEWVGSQIDLDDVLVISHEWKSFREYRHLTIATRTVSDDAQIDYFFKDSAVISFVFQPLHSLSEPDTKGYYLKIIEEYLK
ncbi:MAG: hypothetical protein UW75_C0046G0002 [Parcubacteria group bacterium GW2011_GWF2_44_8]|nr:MAG: hypothetical protein UW75_C0046G0002 [Parcubacteria group bacterium GW2011_GWF2_44_8]